MIQVKKRVTGIPQEYLDLCKRKKVDQKSLEEGHNKKKDGHALIRELKKKSAFEEMKQALIEDQGYICCYCNSRVFIEGSVLEHVIPITENKTLLSEYSNLLISCEGGKSERKNKSKSDSYPIYCDNRKSSTKLPFSPLDDKCWSSFRFFIEDGSIEGNSNEAKQVIETLNLDCRILRERRLEALQILFVEGSIIDEKEMELIWDKFWELDEQGQYEPYFFTVLQNIIELI